MLYAIFFDLKGPVLHIPDPKGSSVTVKFYRESALTQLVDFYQKRRPHTGVRGIKLLHKSTTVQEYLKESGLNVLDHPPYSPDLSPCDFWLFPRLKEMLAGHRFEFCCGIGSAVLIDYFRLFIVATGCPSERRPQKTVSCYGG